MQGNLLWTEKISLGTIRDPLQLAVFRYPEVYFISGIITQTERLRYYTFLTWAWTKIKERKSDLKKNEIRDLEKVFTLASAMHHLDGLPQPNGIQSIKPAKEFIKKTQKIDLDEFQNFGKNNTEGLGNYFYRGSIKNLNILWSEDNQINVSPAGKEISEIFSTQLGENQNTIWKKSFSLSDLKKLIPVCCCNLSISEQNFWRRVFFGMTKTGKSGLETTSNMKISLKNPDELSFEKFQLSEDQITESELDAMLNINEPKSDSTSQEMRKGSLLMILKIIKETTPPTERTSLLQIIRDAIYYSQFESNSIKSIQYGILESYRKYWEVYVHNTYYVDALESTLSLITYICKENPLGIGIDNLASGVDDDKYLKFIQKLGFTVSKNDAVGLLFTQLQNILKKKQTSLTNPLNENKILRSLINLKDDSKNDSEKLAMTLVLLLLCMYRHSTFNEKQLRVLSYKHDKFASILPKNIYQEMSSVKVTDFPIWILKLIIKRHRHVSSKKLLNQGTKSWLFTVERNEVFFNEIYEFNAYRDVKWVKVLEIMHDLGLVQKNPSTKLWNITREGEQWLAKIQ